MSEYFKDIPNYEGLYQVSNLGRVKSLSREINQGFRVLISKERILKHGINSDGYCSVVLYSNSKSKSFKIHKLVAQSYLECNNDKLVVDHINNDKLDNRVENLQYITQRLNSSKDKQNTSSKYTGVSWNKEKKKWKSCIRINGKIKHLGYFTDELEASKSYQNAINVSY
jgi:hypothetical protein